MTRVLIMVTAALLGTLLLAIDGARGKPMNIGDEPSVFDKRPYAEAKKAAADGKKWFIVKATAVWCGPCKRMDATTWQDEKVVKWLTDNAIVVALDVDKNQKIAESLAIESMPTMVAFKEDKEFDRVVGYKAPAEFLGWLEGIAKGEKSIELVKKRAGSREKAGGTVDIRARMDLARSLAQTGKADEAADEFVWLWKHMLEHDASYYGVRLSFMVGDMQRLASRSAAAKKKFTEVRDTTGAALELEKVSLDDVVDWVALNKVIDDNKATLAWYDKVKDQKRSKPLISRVSRELSELLMAESRWADLGRLSVDPVADLEQDHQLDEMVATRAPDGMDEATKKQLVDMRTKDREDKAGKTYAGLLAAAREEDAIAYADKARELYKSPSMTAALITWALKAGQPRQHQVEWLSGADKDDPKTASLRARVENALKEAKGKK